MEQKSLFPWAIDLADAILDLPIDIETELQEDAYPLVKDIPNRVPEYLKHGQDLDQRRTWANLRVMCDELELTDYYDEMYRHSSQVAHGGGQRLYLDLFRLSGQDAPTDWELPAILETGLTCYSWILDIHYQVFPRSPDNKLAFDRWANDRNPFQDALSAAVDADPIV